MHRPSAEASGHVYDQTSTARPYRRSPSVAVQMRPAGRSRAPSPGSSARSDRVDQHQHPAEDIVRGNAAGQLEEALQPVPLAAVVESNVLETLRLGDHGAGGEASDREYSKALERRGETGGSSKTWSAPDFARRTRGCLCLSFLLPSPDALRATQSSASSGPIRAGVDLAEFRLLHLAGRP
jgi:hypothetical protein